MFKSQFAREIQQISSLTEELFTTQHTRTEYENSSDAENLPPDAEKNEENEPEWLDGEKFKKFLDRSESYDCRGDPDPWKDSEDLLESGRRTGIRRSSSHREVNSRTSAARHNLAGSRPSALNLELEEIWGTGGGAKVSELSKIFESSTPGGSEKLNFSARRSPSSRPSSRSGSRPSSTPRSTSNPSSRPSSRFSMATMENLAPAPSPVIRPFSNQQKGHSSSQETSTRHSQRLSRSKPNFKLEPYSPKNIVNEISKVETVLSLGDQPPWPRRDASLECPPWRESQAEYGQGQPWTRREQPWHRKDSSMEQLEGEVQRLKVENSHLVTELEAARESGVRYYTLEKELDQLHWQLSKMEDSRKVYERATNQLVNFLDIVSEQLSTNSPSRSESRQSMEGPHAYMGGPKSRASFGGSGASADHHFAGGSSRFSFGGSSTTRIREGSRLSLGLGSGIRDIQRELETLRAMREFRDTNRERYHSARNLASSRLSLGPTEVNPRFDHLDQPSRPRQMNLGEIPRSRSAMTISGVSEDEPIECYSRQRRRRKTRFKDVIETAVPAAAMADAREISQVRAEDKPKMRQISAEASPVWRREEGSEGGTSLESKDSGRSTDSCSSGRSSPKNIKERDQLASRARRMVNAVRQFLAKEKSKFPENKQADGDPWVIKPKENPQVWTEAVKKNEKSTKQTNEDEQEDNAGRVVIRIRPEKGVQNSRNEVHRAESGRSAKREDGKRKSYSFSHPASSSSISTTADASRENGIKVTKMGTVSVPVPYPVTQQTQWF